MATLRTGSSKQHPDPAPVVPEQLTWTEADVEMLDQLGGLIQSRAVWSGLGTAEVLRLGKYLMDYQSLRNKISAHILELRAYRAAAVTPHE